MTSGWVPPAASWRLPAPPENVIKFYEDAFQKLMEDADYLKAAEAAGMETDYKNSADTAALIKQQQDFTESLADVWGD